jgi:dihydrofolate reductase
MSNATRSQQANGAAVSPTVTLVVAVAENGVIGREGRLPWHLPDDLKRFKALTWGKPILMGRRTFESIGRALPGRRNVVLTRSKDYRPEGVVVADSLEQALALCRDADEVAVIGGAELFRLALPLARRIHLTRVHAAVEGDVHWPPLDPAEWREVAREEHPPDERHAYAMTFLELERVGGAVSESA